jgi:hypothetical protein
MGKITTHTEFYNFGSTKQMAVHVRVNGWTKKSVWLEPSTPYEIVVAETQAAVDDVMRDLKNIETLNEILEKEVIK